MEYFRKSFLLLEIETRFKNGDRLVYLGNFLGRGSAIIETVDEILMFRRALIIYENAYGQHDPRLISSLENISACYDKLGESGIANEFEIRARVIRAQSN